MDFVRAFWVAHLKEVGWWLDQEAGIPTTKKDERGFPLPTYTSSCILFGRGWPAFLIFL
jgi:hypothetical protein